MKYLAVYTEGNNEGLGIIDILYGAEDFCIIEYFSSNGNQRTKNKIYMDHFGRNYIKKFNRKFYLDEFVRM